MKDVADAIGQRCIYVPCVIWMVRKTVVLGQPEVGHLIRKLRHLTGLSQEQFAASVGVSYSTINRWENGHIRPSPLALKHIQAMLRELNRSPVVALQQQSRSLLEHYFSEVESQIQ